MATLKLKTQLLNLERLDVYGLWLALIGLSIVFTPPGANASITNYVSLILSIDRSIIGGLMIVCGSIMFFLHPRREAYFLCIIPWGLYCAGALFFEWENHLSATAGIAYSFIYYRMLRRAFKLS